MLKRKGGSLNEAEASSKKLCSLGETGEPNNGAEGADESENLDEECSIASTETRRSI